MLQNYLKIAYRNLLRHKGYTFLNIAGLAVGLACCLLIAAYVRDELSFDRYHEHANRIYRVLHASRSADSPESLSPLTPEEYQVWGNAPVGAALLADFPEVEKVVQFSGPLNVLVQHGEKRFQEENLFFMDSTVFDVFSWKLLSGNPPKALVAPFSIVLTRSTAQKYFGDRNPIGQILTLENIRQYTVTGVMEDVPPNSHFTFDGLLSMSSLRARRPNIFEEWGYVDFYTYFLLAEGADISSLQAKVPEFLKRHNPNKGYTLSFEPMTDAYLHSQAARQPGVTGSLANIYIFSLVAGFILLIACINFMNLSTARSLERAKEVGVRKVIGAHRSGLVYQFLAESILLTFLAAVLALLLAELALPALQELSGKVLASGVLLSWEVVLIFLGAAVVIGVLAGSYPAWVLSRFRPVQVLKGVFRSSSGGIALRKALVVFQFSLSMALIAGTVVVYSQLEHLRSKNLGFRQDQMVVINFGGERTIQQNIETVKSTLLNHPAVLSAAASRAVPGDFIPNADTEVQSPRGEMQRQSPFLYEIDFDFIPHFGMEMAAGRAYSRDFPADTAQSLVINEAAARLYGFANPEEAVGQKFDQWGRQGAIIGVVKDFNFKSLHHRVEPLALRLATLSEGNLNRLTLRVHSDELPATLAELEQIWRQLAPQRPFLYSFLDESFNRQYQADLRFGQVFSVFAGLAILIACLGLFGLATYTAEQRTKEIGIRKVLGASVLSIVALLSKDFTKLVLLSILIATPASWYAMDRWLEGYPYRVEIGLGIFVLAGLVAIVIALATVSWQSVKAALANPVKSLRSE
jgi:putative ABC transport system permease protein